MASGPAPLRETMAAQLIMLSRWDARVELLVDPHDRKARFGQLAGGIFAAGKLIGIGVASYVEAPVGAPHERVRVAVRDGTTTLFGESFASTRPTTTLIAPTSETQ